MLTCNICEGIPQCKTKHGKNTEMCAKKKNNSIKIKILVLCTTLTFGSESWYDRRNMKAEIMPWQ